MNQTTLIGRKSEQSRLQKAIQTLKMKRKEQRSKRNLSIFQVSFLIQTRMLNRLRITRI